MEALEYIKRIFIELWNVLNEMSPYLLFGFLVAGILSVMIRQETVERHLGGRGLWQITKAAAFGVPLPLCSCGVIPVAASLRKHGASKGATTSFIISTPQTGVDSIFVTYSLLGIAVAIFRPIAALISGILGGVAVSLFDKNGATSVKSSERCTESCCINEGTDNIIYRILHYGFVVLARDIAKPLLAGLLIAGVISVFVPEHFFHGALGTGFTGMLVMLAFGIPIYVCATASVPIAAAFIAKGASPGAAIVFLMTGPATNAAAIITIWKIMGGKTAVIYLITIIVCALSAGFILDKILYGMRIEETMTNHQMIPDYIQITASVILLIVLAGGLYPYFRGKYKKATEKDKNIDEMKPTVLTIKGMTCSHCVNAVKRAILETGRVENAEVDLSSGTATIYGKGFDLNAIRESIEQLGYKVEGMR